MNLLYRQTCGLACLAIFTAIALVGCGQGPGRTSAPEAVRIDPVEVRIGAPPYEISLSNKFSGEKLTYIAESSNKAVATTNVDGATFTITAVGAGTATITVTATDPQERSAETSFRVTVPAPAPTQEEDEEEEEEDEEEEQEEDEEEELTTTSSDLTIKLHESAKRTLSAKQTLTAPAGGGVEVEESLDGETGNVWLITATKKGTWTITINSGGTKPERVGSFVVEVPNSPPRRENTDHPPILLAPERIANSTDSRYKDNEAPYKTENLDLKQYFTDDDADDDAALSAVLRYSIGSKPDAVLIDADGGFVSIDTTGNHIGALKFEVLEEVKESFKVSIYAHDDSGDRSQRPVVLMFPAFNAARLTPSGRIYKPEQGSNGALNKEGALKVGPRIGVDHTLTFESLDGEMGFAFANDLVKKNEEYLTGGTALPATIAPPDSDTPATDANVAVGINYFTLKSDGAVEANWANPSGLNGDPTVTFKLTRKGSGSITIEYTLFKSLHKVTTDTPADNTKKTKASDRKVLHVSVVTCSSPPDPLNDCP